MTSLKHKIALSLIPGIGSINSRKLVSYLGSVEAVFDAPSRSISSIPGIGKTMAEKIIENRPLALKKAESEEEFIDKHNISCYFYLDKNYPKRLTQCEDAPVIIFQKGEMNLDNPRIVSVVGTRNATDYGRGLTEELITGLTQAVPGVMIISGLAFGIDIIAHRSCLKNNIPTVGVVGHGLDKMYPSAHINTAREMITKGGGLLTDFTSNTKIDPGNFPRRNRIVAGLSDCTIVVESAIKGGALVTADIASSYNRDVFAFPGRCSDKYSKGCNDLIKRNKAGMIESSEDLISIMGWDINPNKPIQQILFSELTEEEEKVYSIIKREETISSSAISSELSIPVGTISSILLNLEFKGVVKSLPGNHYKLNSGRCIY
ncbi:MAG: DNA-processing protein DprA [Prolixibacteraceae bacterium]|nr:DNA-processing protein DprA [Prolixibacteraceae bacterium]